MSTVNVSDPAQVAVLLLDMMSHPSSNAAQTTLEVLRAAQYHGVSFAAVGRFMDLLPLETAYAAPAVEPKR